MPAPIFKKIELDQVIKRVVDFYKLSSLNEIKFNLSNNSTEIKGDADQLYRVFFNIIKNSEESILEKKSKNSAFKGKINIEINKNNDYISISLADNGVGIDNTSKIMTPYFTTKTNGTGLGLPIVSKIINEHQGEFTILNNNPGVKVLITLPKLIK